MSIIKFGTDGWRAIIAKDFTFENVKIVAQGIASYANSKNLGKKGIVIGYDNRFMSEDFAAQCAKVLVGNGIKVFLLKKTAPTPVTAFAIRVNEAGGAIMLTASHNPPNYNGIKFIPEYAGPALPDETDAIEEEVNRVIEGARVYELELEEARKLELLEDIDVDKEYIAHLMKIIDVESFKENDLKVVADPMFGAGVGYLDKILLELGCEVRTINNYRDALFGGSMPEPTVHILSDLKRSVGTYSADLGLALDGDADRFGIIDKEGNFVTPNRFSYLLLNHILKTRSFRGPVSRSIATSHMLDRVAKRNGLSVIETPVGFKYIGEAMRDRACILGVEESGGLSIFGHIPEKDGILACLLAAEMLAKTGKTFDELSEEFYEEYGSVVSERLDIAVRPKEKDEILANMKAYHPKSIAGVKVDTYSDKEGNKIVLDDGSWVLIRPSGTEPLFRIYVEAVESNGENKLKEIQQEVLEALGLTRK
ncbi:Phosphoglucosamine mutase [Candidatus Syntrophocurvum alkaliphilum]|uniref:Phosphoglucomutase n=1 Tax=Candidatus Syntrophocurvum alkaliphilum TaxID=2293317 RepID=A0A6I6DH68_9FIRM|nr:phosphoglucomutase/phosphomannomutase family protein [Candidatus Syntrophocurvum alkaliphilum]QGU00443.1 Phosphoglucosamine mutase [Candidatus Syntrophocurvum alkaliphilum]